MRFSIKTIINSVKNNTDFFMPVAVVLIVLTTGKYILRKRKITKSGKTEDKSIDKK